MAQLAQNLTGWTRNDLGRTIVDHTGLTGRYSFSLNWTPDTAPPSNALDTGGGPSIFTAVQEQLGLRLEPGRAPVEVLVVDYAERASPN